ncbi:hypothetical protein AAFF_G00068410 [Aldrovandia affinis]|uniref:Uncharacterized protein n=1 Tax=Aldrovandia affinis TaxID=143900 RepID=A0AAD7RZG1_9TELE|nr:hypothetical protein AAFF_G00068410 [Aldrovandia affinis]
MIRLYTGEDDQEGMGVVAVAPFSSQHAFGYPDRWTDKRTGVQREEIQRPLVGNPQMTALELVAPGRHTLGRSLWREAELLHQQLQCGYQEEALFHTAFLGAAKREHLVRLQALETAMDMAERQRGRALQDSAGARAEHRALLQENRTLLRVLRRVREALEQQEAWSRLPQRAAFGTEGGG